MQNKFYYGWFIVFIAGLALFFSGPGQTFSNAQFIDQYIYEFGWSRSLVSGLYSAATLLAGLLMIFIGRYIDRFGPRAMMIVIGTLFGLACLFNSIVSNIVMLGIGFFLVRFLGQGSMSLIPNALVAQWFIQKRGRAFSFMTLGSFVSAMALPIINTWVIQTWDWQTAWRLWGILMLFVFVPIAYFGVHNRPEMIGLEPDGNQNVTRKNNHLLTTIPESEHNFTLAEAAKTRAFWAILICIGIPAAVNTGITFHIVSIFQINSLSPAMAAFVLSLLAFVSIPMSFVSGFITEKIQTNMLLIIVFVIQIIILPLLIFTTNMATVILLGVLWGIANGFERIGVNIIWPDYFGRKHIGSINGVGMTMLIIGSAVGPLPFGLGYDTFQSYTPVLLFTLILPVIGVISALLAKKPKCLAPEQL